MKTQKYLDARAIIAGDLLVEGKIERTECFRLEMDAALGEDTGDIRYISNPRDSHREYHDFKRNRMDLDNPID